MRLHSWELFLNQLVIDSVYSSTRAGLYKNLGIHWQDWPECKAKDLAKRYERRALEKSEDSARFHIAQEIETLQGCEMPEETFAISARYQDMIKFGNVTQLAHKLLQDPMRFDEIQSAFKSKSLDEVEFFDLAHAVRGAIDQHEQELQSGRAKRIIPGWPILSEMIGGFNEGRITLLVAGTGIGKTNLALNLALSAIAKMRVLFFNMEMTRQDIVARCIRQGARMTAKQWFKGDLDLHGIAKWFDKLLESKALKISDGKALTLNNIIGRIFSENEADELGLVIVDYDQKIRSAYKGEEWQNLQRIVEELEECAKATKTHIIILAQGDDKGDPKASKRMKQAASTVLSFYEEQGRYFIKASKNRHGKYGEILEVNYNPSMSFVSENRLIDPTNPFPGQVLV